MGADSHNETVVLRFYEEVVNGRDPHVLAEVMDDGYVEHGEPRFSGVDGFLSFVERLLTAFPDLKVEVEDLLSDGNRVVARVTVRGTHLGSLFGAIEPTGKVVAFSGIDIFEIGEGRIVGRWSQRDLVGLFRQLGASLP